MADSNADESDLIIYQGATQTQLLKMFAVDHTTIKRALTKCTPCGMRGTRPVYKISEAAPHIVKPSVTPEELERFLKESDHHALPAVLRKEFWVAQRQRQDFELKAGNLWPTDKVIENCGALFKLVNMQIRLMADAVERQTELTDRQRAIVKSQCAALLKDMQRMIGEMFGTQKNNDAPVVDDDEI